MSFNYVIIQCYFMYECVITVDTCAKYTIASYFGMML
nr:unnamed protein product [Callosobruchus analis]